MQTRGWIEEDVLVETVSNMPTLAQLDFGRNSPVTDETMQTVCPIWKERRYPLPGQRFNPRILFKHCNARKARFSASNSGVIDCC